MPHTTHKYPFEFRVLEASARLAASCRAAEPSGAAPAFLLIVGEDAAFECQTFGEDDARHDIVDGYRSEGKAFIFFDPVDDGCEFNWLQWHAIDRVGMEKLIAYEFTESDFRSHHTQEEIEFPVSWSVMF